MLHVVITYDYAILRVLRRVTRPGPPLCWVLRPVTFTLRLLRVITFLTLRYAEKAGITRNSTALVDKSSAEASVCLSVFRLL